MLNNKNIKAGFTLIEILISITVFIIVLGSIFSIFYFFVQRDGDLMARQIDISESRIFISQISKELRNAKINTTVDRSDSICPELNNTYKINDLKNSISFILNDICIRYRVEKNDDINILVRDEESIFFGDSIASGVSVLSPKTEVVFLNFNTDSGDQSYITISIKLQNNSKNKSLFYQFSVKNSQELIFNDNYLSEANNIKNESIDKKNIYEIKVDSNFIYIIYKDSSIDIYGVRDNKKKGSLSSSIYISEVTSTILYNNYLIIFGTNIDRDGGWYRVVDISPVHTGLSPVQVVRGSDATQIANFLLIKDNYLYVSLDSNNIFKSGISIYSISERGNLNLENTFNDSVNFSHHLALNKNRLYQESWEEGFNSKSLREYDISNPTNPLLLNIYKNINPGSFAIKDGLLYATDEEFQIFDINNISSGRLNKKSLNIGDYNDNINIIGSNIIVNKSENNSQNYYNHYDSAIIINVSDQLNPFVKKENIIGVDILRGGTAYSKNLNNEIKMLKLFNINNVVEK